MKKKIIEMLIIICILLCIFILYHNKDRIKKGDIFTDVTFKEELPIINSKNEVGLVIEDNQSDTFYTISYNCFIPEHPSISFTKTTKNEYFSYVYNWEEVPQENGHVYVPKGWSIYKEEKKFIKPYSSISYNKIGPINGKVTYTKGKTSLLKDVLNNI